MAKLIKQFLSEKQKDGTEKETDRVHSFRCTACKSPKGGRAVSIGDHLICGDCINDIHDLTGVPELIATASTAKSQVVSSQKELRDSTANFNKALDGFEKEVADLKAENERLRAMTSTTPQGSFGDQ